MVSSSPNTFAALAQPRRQELAQNAAPDGPEQAPARKKAVQLSKNLMGLKFMQRSVEKMETATLRSEATEASKVVSLLLS
jgi:hypothetical protein